MRRAWPLLLGLLALASPGTVLAHALLVSASPAPGAQVPPQVGAIQLTFDQALIDGSGIVLYAADFQKVAGLQTSVDGQVLTAALAGPLPAGVYTVQWFAVSPDGHPTQGSYQFGVRPAAFGWPAAAGLAAAAALLAGGAWLWRRRAAD
jgi:copper resistance protein C